MSKVQTKKILGVCTVFTVLTLQSLQSFVLTSWLPHNAPRQVRAQENTFSASISPESIGLEISPPTAYVRVKPGSQTTHTITIQNNSDKTQTLQPRLHDFETDGLTGIPIIQDFTTFPYVRFQDGRSLESGWDAVELLPGQKAQLTLLLSVPPESPEKEWPLTILFTAQTTDTARPQSAAALRAAIGSNLIVLVSKDEELSRKLRVLKSGVPFFADSLRPLELKPVLKNEHYAATAASGSAVLKNWRGNEVAAHPLYPDIILGYSSRETAALGELSGDTEQEIPERKPLVFKPGFFLGLYTVSYRITTTEGVQEEISNHTVLAIPLLGSALVLAMSTIGAIYWKLKEK